MGLENSSATMIPINSVLLTCTASIGKVAINSIPLATNQQFNSFQCFKEILPKYLAYYFLIIKGRLTKISGKTSFLHITIGNLNKIEIPVPPLPIQRKIVSILERAEKLKNLRQEANDETNTMTRPAAIVKQNNLYGILFTLFPLRRCLKIYPTTMNTNK